MQDFSRAQLTRIGLFRMPRTSFALISPRFADDVRNLSMG